MIEEDYEDQYQEGNGQYDQESRISRPGTRKTRGPGPRSPRGPEQGGLGGLKGS